MKKILKAIWKFISYLFVPQKTDKTRYDTTGSSQVIDANLKEQITYIIGKERAEGCIDTPLPEYVSKVLNVPLEEVERVMREMGM